LFGGKVKSKREGLLEVEEAYNSGAIRLRGSKVTTWIVNGQQIKHCMIEEQNSIELILVVSPKEEIRRMYGVHYTIQKDFAL
jgi:ABC-type ATPase with predicted acetyltransferase domain